MAVFKGPRPNQKIQKDVRRKDEHQTGLQEQKEHQKRDPVCFLFAASWNLQNPIEST